ncbi:MarR family winged helix-turn-helix transcriptional regulator [Cellulomonas endophytica]|uniref:MarR family winged helix-turn-helix transcriptional regulator n=1 Tax=Cellulomonas endophytica TaxID=2494735 RepID=UPI0010104426|nr:MarR family transcriptional regulator [Cellulomonas endophytica]
MEPLDGAQFARLLLGAFDAMVDEVRTELEAAGHPGLTVANEMAVQAIGDGVDNAAALARAVGVSRQAAAKTITHLEALGYVERRADSADGRRKRLTVTRQGIDATAVGAAAFQTIYRRWQADVGADHAASVVRALHRLAGKNRAGGSSDPG